jgi:tellurite resistance protein
MNRKKLEDLAFGVILKETPLMAEDLKSRKMTSSSKTAPIPKSAMAKASPEDQEVTPDQEGQFKSLSERAHMPVSLFGITLGIAGFAVAWREAGVAYGVGPLLSQILMGIALGIYMLVAVLYILKFSRYRRAVFEDFRHPIQGHFFAAATMTLMIFASGLNHAAPLLAAIIWSIGAAANLIISVLMVTSWINQSWTIAQITPVWFIPVVGNLVTPITGVSLGFSDLSWMVFSIGLLFWIALFVIIFYRLMFKEPLEGPLRPTLCILVAPPSLCFIALTVLNKGEIDGSARMFLGIAAFMVLILCAQLPVLWRLPFTLNWWSYIFPLASFTTALILYSEYMGEMFLKAIAIVSLIGLTGIVILVTVCTCRFMLAGKLFQPPPVQSPS